MITLFSFGRAFGLPDVSPFVTKVEMYLRMAKLDYKLDNSGFRKAPKGKLPYINDGGKIVSDSTFIRFYLESKHGFDLDAELSPSEKAIAWAFEKMCEDHLYWAALDMRWNVDANYQRGAARFFKKIPFPVRPLIEKMVRGKVRNAVKNHGMGMHARSDIELLAARDIAAISDYLGDKKYFMGERATAADATIFPFVAAVLCPHFEGPMRTAAESHPNLRAYAKRMRQEYFPDLAEQKSAVFEARI